MTSGGTKTIETYGDVGGLKACLNDLIGILALPAIWAGQEQDHVIKTLIDAICRIFELDFVYASVNLPDGKRIEGIRVTDSGNTTESDDGLRTRVLAMDEAQDLSFPGHGEELESRRAHYGEDGVAGSELGRQAGRHRQARLSSYLETLLCNPIVFRSVRDQSRGLFRFVLDSVLDKEPVPFKDGHARDPVTEDSEERDKVPGQPERNNENEAGQVSHNR